METSYTKHEHIDGKKIIEEIFNHKKTYRAGWVPLAGIHSASFKNWSAKEILQDSEKLFQSNLELNKLYDPDGQPIVFDLQIEAEILGCELAWADKAPPSVKSHPLSSTQEIPKKIPTKNDGRIPIILDVTKKLKEKIGQKTALFGLLTGPLTLASHLRGNALFLDLLRNKEYANNLIEYCSKVAISMIDYYCEAGIDIIAIVDPLVSQISPRTFSKLLEQQFIKLFNYIRDKSKKSAFLVCGDATKNIEVMCKTGPDAIFVDENVNFTTAKEITDKYNIVLGGNIPLTTTMLYGTKEDNIQYVLKMIDQFTKIEPDEGENRKYVQNLIIAPGCDMPYDTPADNGIAVGQTIRHPEQMRAIVENYSKIEEEFEIDLPDYKNLSKPLIEVFTLDSDQCPACSYMKTMAFSALNKFGEKIEIVEYKWTEKINYWRAKKLGVNHIPSIFINGKLYWESIIPDQKTYFNILDKLITEMKKS